MDERKQEVAPGYDSKNVARRLILGSGASLLGPLITLVFQLVTVPVFFHYWAAERYGEWLVLAAIPTYLAMTDMGFGTVAGNEMTMQVARGDIAGALRTFQSTWKLLTLMSLALAAVVLPLVCLLPVHQILKLKTISVGDAQLTLAILALDALACLQTSLPVSAFKATGQYHLAVLGLSVIRVVEGSCLIVAVALGSGPVVLALVLLSVRATGNLCLALAALRFIPWLRFSFQHANGETLRALTRPAIAFMGIPAAQSLNVQGALIAIGIVLGPIYVSMFAPLRTATRMALQATEILKLSFGPELSAAYGVGHMELARKLHRFSCQLGVVFGGSVCLFLAAVGPWLLGVWTHHKIAIDLPTFYLLLAGVAVNALWNTSTAVPVAANKHQRVALEQLLSTVGSLMCAAALMHFIGLPGCALGLLLGEIYMVFSVIPSSNRLLGDHLPAFVASLCDPVPLLHRARRQLAALASR